jgi:hypothetical protein
LSYSQLFNWNPEGIMSKQATEALLLGNIIRGFERRVNEYKRYCEAHPRAAFPELERKARELSHDCFALVLEAGVQMQRWAAEEAPRCSCGRLMAYKGDQVRQLETWVGRITLRRGYYYCRVCHKGRYPLDEAVGIGPGQFSDGIQAGISRLAARQPFKAAADDFSSLSGTSITGREVERLSEERGQVLEAQRAAERAKLFAGEAVPPRKREDKPGVWAVALDAAKGHFKDGWHDIQAGVVFRAWAKVGKDGTAGVQAREQSYIAEVGPLEEGGRKLYAEGVRRGIDPARDLVVCLGDGAAGIWKQFLMHFPKRVEILDWWHAMDHLWKAGKGVFGEGTDEAKAWVKAREAELWAGNVEAVITALKAEAERPKGEAAADEIHYFETNKERMRYDQFRAAGYPIGSGTVESACKRLIAARIRESGMIWTQRGAQAILALRAELLSDRWDEAWRDTRRLRRAA